MSLRRFAAPTAFALALATALPAAAEELPGDATAMAAAPDMRPEWRGPPMGPAMGHAPFAAMQPDARTRDAWLNECRRRTAMYYYGGRYDGGRHYRRQDQDHGYRGGYDYCEAYFDDYYRTYTQHGFAYAQPMMMMVPQQVTASRMISRPVEEVVTEEYVPVETRVYQRRPARRIIRDKRIRVAP